MLATRLFWAIALVFVSWSPIESFAESRGVRFKSDIIPLGATATKLYDLDLKTLLADPGVGALEWAADNNLPAWLTLDSPNSRLKGTPALSDAGTKSFRLSVKDGESGALARIDITVVIAPIWSENPINLGKQKEDQFWQFDLKTKVSDPSGGQLTFSVANKRAMPQWMTLTPAGILSGTPRRVDVGKYTGITFIARTQSGGEARADAFGEVEKVLKGPKFTGNPLIIDNAHEDFPYSKDVSGPSYVINPEGGALSFKLLEAPASGWLKMTASGNFFGTPGKNDLGPVLAKVELSSTIEGQTFKDETYFKFTVLHTNHTPRWTTDPVQLPQATSKIPYAQDLVPFVSDPDGDQLTFKMVPGSGPAWATVTSAGVLSGTPDNTVLGANTWVIEVSDGEFSPQATIRVVVINRPPIWLNKPTVLPKGKEGTAYSQNIAGLARDPDGDALKFTMVSGPTWATVTSDGVFSGTPMTFGLQKFRIRVEDGFSGSDEADVHVDIEHVNHAPKWTSDPISLPNAKEKVAYSSSVTQFATDPDQGDTLTFSKVSGPAWVSVSAAGVVSGTPARIDVGTTTMKVRVKDQGGLSADATVTIIVEKVNMPPVWTQDPVSLGSVSEEGNVLVDLKPFTFDADGDPLTFTKINGPTWLSISADGKVTGTTPAGSAGDYSAVFQISDGTATAQAGAQGKIVKKNYPPQITQPIAFSVKERATFTESLKQDKYVKDPNGDPITFTLIDNLDWVKLTVDGQLTLTPKFKDIGTKSVKFRVSDGSLSSEGTLTLTVVRDPRPPVWLEDPIRFNAQSRVPFSASVADKVKDLDNLPVTFSKKSGPDWLTVDASGKLGGTPPDEVVGENKFVITVKNDLLGADGNVIITVTMSNHPPQITQPITFSVKERSTFTESLKQDKYVKDPNGDPLTFTLIDNLDWVKLTSDGQLTLTPKFKDIGTKSVKFKVSDGSLTSEGTLTLTVVRDPRPPVWLEDPVRFSAQSRVPFSATVADKVKDLDNLPLTFTKKSGPDWLIVDATGKLGGTPPDEMVGENKFVITVKNDVLGTDGNVIITVSMSNHPPQITQPITFSVKERSTFTESLKQDKYVKDPNGDPLSFTLVDNLDWVKLTSDGQLTLTPKFKDIGTKSVKFKVSDGSLTSEGTLTLTVVRDPRPPVWLEDPVRFNAQSRVPFSATVADKVKDLDNLPLTFAKKSGPDWLTVDAAGRIGGTPPDEAVGENKFVITVKNDLLGADGNVIITVSKSNRPPVWSQDPITLPNAMVSKPYSQSIKSFASDPDNDPLVFSKVSGPNWVTIAADGALSGTPQTSDIGLNTIRARVTDSAGATADATINITVEKTNRPPVWTQDPINLPKANVGQNYSQSVASFAVDMDGDPLTFSKLSGPEWAFVTSAGLFIGTPAVGDLGVNTFKVRVTDAPGLFADVTVTITVENGAPNNPPQWLKNPIPLGNLAPNVTFQFNLASLAKDPDNDPLTFRMTAGPGWMTVSSAGMITGNPTNANMGQFTAQFAVSDGKAEVLADAFGQVTTGENKPPIIKPEALGFIIKERQIFKININQPQYVQDPEGDPLTFELVSPSEWITLSSNGDLEMRPVYKHIGDHIVPIRVRDDKGHVAEGPMNVRVLRDPRPPVWAQDPIRMEAKVDEAFNQTLADKAKDLDGIAISFAKDSGPDWLMVGPSGAMGGTPRTANLGENVFKVSVKNDLMSAQATLIITVKASAPIGDKFQIDKASPGALAENLWVVDNSWAWAGLNRMIAELKDNIRYYYEELGNAQVHHTGIYLSSDYVRWGGLPSRPNESSVFLSWTSGNIVSEFIGKVNEGFNVKCSTSPIWSMFKFYEQVPRISNIYHNNYFTEKAPMDVLILTKHSDSYKVHSRKTPQANWTPDDYARNFIDFHKNEKQPYRISAISAECQPMLDPMGEAPEQTADKNPYRTLVGRTGGQYLPWDCSFDMKKALKDYAQQVIFRAHVSNNKSFLLSKTPSDPNSIKVTLAGVELPGNTGSATDLWYYNATKNEIIVNWSLIDWSVIKPGDIIEIRYQT